MPRRFTVHTCVVFHQMQLPSTFADIRGSLTVDEKARRRDPRLFNYTGIACPDMKKVLVYTTGIIHDSIACAPPSAFARGRCCSLRNLYPCLVSETSWTAIFDICTTNFVFSSPCLLPCRITPACVTTSAHMHTTYLSTGCIPPGALLLSYFS